MRASPMSISESPKKYKVCSRLPDGLSRCRALAVHPVARVSCGARENVWFFGAGSQWDLIV